MTGKFSALSMNLYAGFAVDWRLLLGKSIYADFQQVDRFSDDKYTFRGTHIKICIL